MTYTLFYILCFVVTAALCFDGMRMKDLSIKTAGELKNILLNKDLDANCGDDQQTTTTTKYFLYDRINSQSPIELTYSNLNKVSVNKKVIVIIPGWLTKPTTSLIVSLKDAYLKRYDCSLIIVDWSEIAFRSYTQIFCDVPRIGLEISQLLCQLTVPLNSVHILGHSLGAQIAGYVGKNTENQCNQQLGRISGLDPAGPIYKLLSNKQRLSKSDALFVDVIHTDFQFGILESCGQVDFHLNCVYVQPECPDITEIDYTNFLSIYMCSSLRSIELMAQSVNFKQFIAVSCSLCSKSCEADAFAAVYTLMGEDCREVPTPATNFLINTENKTPFNTDIRVENFGKPRGSMY